MFLPGITVDNDIIDVSFNTIKSRNNLVDKTLKRSGRILHTKSMGKEERTPTVTGPETKSNVRKT